MVNLWLINLGLEVSLDICTCRPCWTTSVHSYGLWSSLILHIIKEWTTWCPVRVVMKVLDGHQTYTIWWLNRKRHSSLQKRQFWTHGKSLWRNATPRNADFSHSGNYGWIVDVLAWWHDGMQDHWWLGQACRHTNTLVVVCVRLRVCLWERLRDPERSFGAKEPCQ